MNVQIVQIDPIRVAMIRHSGSYEAIKPKFDSLFEWAERQRIHVSRAIGIYWDNTDHVPVNELRSAACAEIPRSYVLNDRGGLPIEISEILGGEYATFRYVGPYEDMEPVWSKFTMHVEGKMRRQISDRPAFEVYVNDPETTDPSALITELFLPLS